jgi:PqqA peptide cyclase
MVLLAELTYRCPLRCGYCSNPVDWKRFGHELDAQTWVRVIEEAADLGVLQLHLSGGEPLLREDVEILARAGRDAGMYINVITSAWGATENRVRSLADAGVDHVQVSFQDTDSQRADTIAGTTVHAHKLDVARWVRAYDMELSVNVVLHRANIAHTRSMIDLAVTLGAQRIELANTQFHGSALPNRAALMPEKQQIDDALAVAHQAAEQLRGTMDVIFVVPDWYADTPKRCMDGWGSRFVTVIPDGTTLPCPGAHALPGMAFDNVKHQSLSDIWYTGKDFQRFRDTSWMPEPCRSCDRREIDLGGCRCQAFALTGNVHATDPACIKAPEHYRVVTARTEHNHTTLYRLDVTRKRLQICTK